MRSYPLHTPLVVKSDSGQWPKTIGSSEVAALFEAVAQESPPDTGEEYEQDGQPVTPYLSPFFLWALKTGKIRKKEADNSRARWGKILEKSIAQEVAKSQGWNIRRPPGYYLHPHVRGMGAYLDAEVDEGDGIWRPLEVKTVAASEAYKWRNAAGDYFPPMHVYLQVQHQLSVTGVDHAWIAVLFGGAEDRIIRVQRDEELIPLIERAVKDFWLDVDAGKEPKPDETRDLAVLKRLYAHIDAHKVLDWSHHNEMRDTVAQYISLGHEIANKQKERDRLMARIRAQLRDASAANLGDIMLKVIEVPGGEFLVRKEPYTIIRTIKTKPRRQTTSTTEADIHKTLVTY